MQSRSGRFDIVITLRRVDVHVFGHFDRTLQGVTHVHRGARNLIVVIRLMGLEANDVV